jgi:uncharacterized protein YggE
MEKKDIHKLVLRYILTLFAVMFIIAAVPAVSRWGSSLAPARTLTVSAQGKTTATPDLAEISFSVVSQGASPDALNTDNNQKMSAVVTFVKSLGIASSDIATTEYDLSPNYTNTTVTVPQSAGVAAPGFAISVPVTTMSSSSISGYTLTQTVQVKVRDFSNIAKLLGGLPSLGINQIGGVSFTFDKPETFLAIARADAITQAKAKAGEMSAEAGTSLGMVMSVQEYGNVPEPYAMNMAAPMAEGAASKVVMPTIEPGTQDVTDQVTITYELR